MCYESNHFLFLSCTVLHLAQLTHCFPSYLWFCILKHPDKRWTCLLPAPKDKDLSTPANVLTTHKKRNIQNRKKAHVRLILNTQSSAKRRYVRFTLGSHHHSCTGQQWRKCLDGFCRTIRRGNESSWIKCAKYIKTCWPTGDKTCTILPYAKTLAWE